MCARAPVCAFLAAWFTAGVATSAQSVLKVPSQYKTIQAAIGAAKNRDTVLVAPGTYQGPIDFRGKAITVRSSGGPWQTIVETTPNSGAVVIFQSGEGRHSVLDGFTVRNGKVGIFIKNAAPTVQRNIITGNSSNGTSGIHCLGAPAMALILENTIARNAVSFAIDQGRGGGIFCDSAVVVNNVISGNYLMAYGTMRAEARGGGVYCSNTLLINNVVAGNSAYGLAQRGYAYGGGVFCGPNVRVINNTVIGNTASAAVLSSGGGIGGLPAQVVNSIVRDNFAAINVEVSAGPVTFSNVKGGFPGTGNFDADPRFVDEPANDYHLRHDSPCRNSGTNGVLNFSATDLEWDPRTADGQADVGADEFFPHLYHVGTPTPGGKIEVKLIGKPQDAAFWAYNFATLDPPIPIPGLKGLLLLSPAGLFVIPLGQFPVTGVLTVPVKFPMSFPRVSIPTQALSGLQLTNLDTLHVL